MNPKRRLRFAWALIALSLIGWPVTAFTVARQEPQIVLALSWLAILLTAVDILSTTDVRATQDDDE